MTHVHVLTAALDEELEVGSFADGQHNGLQVEGGRPVKRLATSVGTNLEVLEQALTWGADALLTHHGLLWHNQPLHVQGLRRTRLKRLLDADASLLSYHLPLDAHPVHGNNAGLAELAGCSDTASGFAYKGQAVGIIGKLPAPRPFTRWIVSFEQALRKGCPVHTGPFQVWPFGPDEIQSIGFLSGAGPYQVQDAIDMGLDAYVTGEVTEAAYHLAKEAKIHFIGGGHYLTERSGPQRIGAWAAARFGLEHRFFDVETRA